MAKTYDRLMKRMFSHKHGLGDVGLDGLTASRLLATNSGGDITALDTATYPNLTELSYVKGVTSSIQDQIDAIGGGGGGDWVEVPHTLTRTGATTFTASGDLTADYQPGDKFRCSQTTGGTKYWVIIGVSHAGGTTTFTIAATTAYTLESEAITDPHISRVDNPIGFPAGFDYTPHTITGFSANPTNSNYRYHTHGRSCTVSVSQGADGTSNATGFTIGLPITAASITNQQWIVKCGFARDNGSYTADADARIAVASDPTVILLARNGSGVGWTASGGKRAFLTITYEF